MTNKIPDYEKIMLPLLRMLGDNQPHSLSDVLQTLSKQFELSDEDLRIRVPSGQQPLFKNRVTWATSYLKNSGLISYYQRGVYKLTELGASVLAENPLAIDTNYLKKFADFRNWQSSMPERRVTKLEFKTPMSQHDEQKTPEEVIGDAVKDLNDKLAFELLELIKSKPADYFEHFVLALLSRMGYGGTDENNFEVVGKSGDNGIDGIIYQDTFGIERVYVQAKRWTDNKVHSKDIRDFIGSLSLKGTNKGIFITTSDFTEDAMATVRMNPQNRIVLISGKELAECAIKYNVGIQVKTEYLVKTLDNDFFEDA